ncbi:dimethylarginine dimethylaminohydrolase family protein [Pararhizobium antarcticum]|uniref:arginine deiminase n=1 Tax=Pararhizobium antarcticum TaxID=1798805 RepID=A0A657LY22_9HYPH|nr:arginine deiminase family protein [Pararhizobium antarcticum]OJF98457.1 amidinotransferase [Rhizobium sp. 58]OJG01011.1 amidinotransferase [Pararhizobium antarcticum]
MTAYGSQEMSANLTRVLMRRPGASLTSADHAKWHYGPTFDGEKAVRQYQVFASLVEKSGAEILWLEDNGDGLADAMFTHDPSLMTDHGAVILNMGKPLRVPEPALHEAAYKKAGIPILGRITSPGTVEGGDCIWLDAETLVVGRGVRTNEEGITQLAELLQPHGITVLSYDLPLWHGEDACLHLMSVMSPLSSGLALVFAPLLPAAFYQLLKEWGVAMVEAPADEFHASNGLSLNVLPVRPNEVIMVSGFPKTKAAMEAAGCTVTTFDADALCIACEGGPTCLTRPVLRRAP